MHRLVCFLIKMAADEEAFVFDFVKRFASLLIYSVYKTTEKVMLKVSLLLRTFF